LAPKINTFKLGLFILICSLLGIGAVIWLGASHFLKETKPYVSYFDASVRGLQRDAVVNYRGVAVGRVGAVDLAPDGRLIEVTMHLNPEFQVEEGLAVQLREQGLTGLRYIEIDTAPENIEQLTPKLTFQPPHPVIPTYPSEMDQLKAALESVYEKLINLDVEGLATNWKQTAVSLNRILEKFENVIQPEEWNAIVGSVKDTARYSSVFMKRLTEAATQQRVDEGVKNLNATLAATRQASDALSKQLKSMPPNALADMTRGWQETAKGGGELFTSVDRHLAESTVMLQQSLQQFHLLLTQLNGLVQSLKERPSRILRNPDEPDPFKRN
jgi:phospholipid/cholesterol/gamma-HCH transport system substrate-binding protein